MIVIICKQEQNRVVQSPHRSYKRSHGMQGGDSDPISFGKERRYDDSLDSRFRRQKRSDEQQGLFLLLTRFHLVKLLPIGCINCFAYFRKVVQALGGICSR